jgi:hypothetical protein
MADEQVPVNAVGPAPADTASEAKVLADAAIRAHKVQQAWNAAAVWLGIIAALTGLNEVLRLEGSTSRFMPSLVATRELTFLTVPMGQLGDILQVIAVVLAVSIFIALALAVRKQQRWALWTGILLYGADVVLYMALVGFSNYVTLIFRVFVLAFLVGAVGGIRRIESSETAATAATSPLGSAIGGWLALLLGAALLVVVEWLAWTMFTEPGSQSLGLMIAALGVALAGLFAWIGVRMLLDARKAREAATVPGLNG